MDISFVQARFCSGDAVQNMIVVEMKVSTSHLKTWAISQEYQEWEDDEAQFSVRLYNSRYNGTDRSQEIRLFRKGDIYVPSGFVESVRVLDGMVIDGGLQSVDSNVSFQDASPLAVPVLAPIAPHPIPPLIPQQIGMSIGPPSILSPLPFPKQVSPLMIWRARLMVTNVLNDVGVVNQEFFLIRVQFVENPQRSGSDAQGTWQKPDGNVLTTLAQGLTSPEDGNVEFQAISGDGMVNRLFAHRSVLSFKSDVFKKGNPLSLAFSNPEEFQSGFKGVDPTAVHPHQCPRRIIQSTLRYEPLHVLLFYLYSDNVLFSTSTTIEEHLDMPLADAEVIFAAAHFYDIRLLKDKAAAFLANTCNEHNILSRFFGEYGLIYDELFEAYKTPFCRYWGQLKNSEEFDNVFEVRDTKGMSREEIVGHLTYLEKVNRRFRELAKGFSMDYNGDVTSVSMQPFVMHQF